MQTKGECVMIEYCQLLLRFDGQKHLIRKPASAVSGFHLACAPPTGAG